eukprot:m51a1_g5484 hypothetical protein (207) ;mRNA; r:315744-316446
MMNPEANVFVPSRRSPTRGPTSPVPHPACACGCQHTISLGVCSHSFCRECVKREFTAQVFTSPSDTVVCPVCRAPVADRDLKPLVDAAVFARLVSRRPLPPPRMRTPSPPSSPRRSPAVVLVPGAKNVQIGRQQPQQVSTPPRTPSPIALNCSARKAPASPNDRLRALLLGPQDPEGSDQYICNLPADFWASGCSSDLMTVVAASS